MTREVAGLLIIISGPSGSGKGTVVSRLCPKGSVGDCAVSISVTTRAPREGEVDGENYFFRTEAEFFQLLKQGELLESATFCGHYYGTPRSYVNSCLKSGKNVVLEIDVNGALQVRSENPESILIFLMPPTMEELKRRLIGRSSETAESLEDRLRRASEEVKLIDKYDYLVINDTIEYAVDDIKTIIRAEKLRPRRSQNLDKGIVDWICRSESTNDCLQIPLSSKGHTLCQFDLSPRLAVSATAPSDKPTLSYK